MDGWKCISHRGNFKSCNTGWRSTRDRMSTCTSGSPSLCDMFYEVIRERQLREMLGLSLRKTQQLEVLKHYTACVHHSVIICQPVHQARITLWRVREMLAWFLRKTQQLDLLRHYTVCLCQCVNFSSDATYAVATYCSAIASQHRHRSDQISRIGA